MSRFRFVEDHQDTYPVKRPRELVEASRSGFYAWRNRALSTRDVDDAELVVEIRSIHDRPRGTYGAPRFEGQLGRAGRCHGRKRVARLMRIEGLVGAHACRKWRCGKTDAAPAGDLLERDFSAQRPDERWVADITEFATDDGKPYLAGIFDLRDRACVGWSMHERATADLVIDALVLAIRRREPDGVTHHSDHGSGYTSLRFAIHLEDKGPVASFGSVSDCYDNDAMEALWATLKRERASIHQRQRWSRAELRVALFDYIEVFCNRVRHQGRLDHRTPAETYAVALVA